MTVTATADPEKILQDLHELWEQVSREQAESGGVLRACAMTLLVAARDDADAEEARRILGVLMRDHPSRALVLRIQGGNKPEPALGSGQVEAHVFAECWKPFGRAQQICAEGVEISAGPQQLAEVAHLVVPLRVPDLPVVLWCRGPSAFDLRAFDNLFPLADKVIFDSATIPGGAAALGFLRSLRAQGYRVADLTWTRLTGWREILAHLFDDQALSRDDVSWARVAHGGSSPSTDALYIGAWIGHALPAAHISFDKCPDGSGPGMCSIALGGSKGELLLTRVPAKESRSAEPAAAGEAGGGEGCSDPGRSGSCLEVSGCGRHYRSLLPPTDEESLMREELKIMVPDPVYESVLG